MVLQSHLDMVCERDPASPFDPREGRIDVRVEGDWVAPTARRSAPTTGSASRPPWPSPTTRDRARAARAPLHRLRGAGARRREGARRVARLRPPAVEPRRDERRRAHDRVRRERPHARAYPARPRSCSAWPRGAPRRALGGKGRPLGRRHRRGPRERDQGARTCSRRGTDSASSAHRRSQPKRDPARRGRTVALAKGDQPGFRAAAEAELETIAREFAGTDDELALSFGEDATSEAAGVDESRRAIDLVQAIPTGVLAMTPGLPGVVATSTSLTTAATEDGTLVLGSMTRSSNAAALDGVLSVMHALARLGGAEIEVSAPIRRGSRTSIRRSWPPPGRHTRGSSKPSLRSRSSTAGSSARFSARSSPASRWSRSARRSSARTRQASTCGSRARSASTGCSAPCSTTSRARGEYVSPYERRQRRSSRSGRAPASARGRAQRRRASAPLEAPG